MITPAQCRAARGLLDWNQGRLAKAANVARQTINDFETGKRMPMPNNLRAIEHALADVGIDFFSQMALEDGVTERSEGVSLQVVGPFADQRREELGAEEAHVAEEKRQREGYLRKVRDKLDDGGR